MMHHDLEKWLKALHQTDWLIPQAKQGVDMVCSPDVQVD
jgi:hypothetical protein